MTAANLLDNARRELQALSTLLREAAARRQSTDQIVADAMAHIEEATRIIETMTDDEGTE